MRGPWDPARGLRCNPAKLLLDPYAQAVHGEVAFGPEVFDYDPADQDTPSGLDSAGHVPRGIVTDAAFGWDGDEPPRQSMPDTIIYEAHVKGLTMRHPDVPEPLRGTYAGLAMTRPLPAFRPARGGPPASRLRSGPVRYAC